VSDQPDEASWLGRLLESDIDLSARLEVPPGPLRFLALVVAHSGDSPLWVAGGVAAILFGGELGRVFGLRALIATIVAGVIASLLKQVFRRSRPAESFGALYSEALDRHAFPSAHAARAGCVVVALSPLLPSWGIGLLAVWAGAVCLARVALQVHYLLDVSAGLILGTTIGAVLLLVL
jgi:undecaprenyl-diphosphatase